MFLFLRYEARKGFTPSKLLFEYLTVSLYTVVSERRFFKIYRCVIYIEDMKQEKGHSSSLSFCLNIGLFLYAQWLLKIRIFNIYRFVSFKLLEVVVAQFDSYVLSLCFK